MSGRVFLLGDDTDTDQLAPGQYMKGGLKEIMAHCLEGVRADFPETVKRGDVIVAGRNFGMGSSREQAAEALRDLGVAGVVALSFAGIFYRNAINLGLPVLVAAETTDAVEDGDRAELDIDNGKLVLTEKAIAIGLDPLPDNLKRLLADGGLVPHLKKRFAAADERRQ